MKFPPDYADYHDNNNTPENPPRRGIVRAKSLQQDVHDDSNHIVYEFQNQVRHPDKHVRQSGEGAITNFGSFSMVCGHLDGMQHTND